MPHKYSLKNKKEIDEVFKKGNRRHARYLTIFFLPANDNKFAFITPKKYIKLASHRNYTRRILREISRTYLTVNMTTGNHYIFFCKTDIRDLRKEKSYDEISRDILNALQSIKP